MPVFNIKHGVGTAALGESADKGLDIITELEARETAVDQAQQRIDIARQQAEDYAFDRSEGRRQRDEQMEFSQAEALRKEEMYAQKRDDAYNATNAAAIDYYGGPDDPRSQALQAMEPGSVEYFQAMMEAQEGIKERDDERAGEATVSRIEQMMDAKSSNPAVKGLLARYEEGVPPIELRDEAEQVYKGFVERQGLHNIHAARVERWSAGIEHADLADVEDEVRQLIQQYDMIQATDPRDPTLADLEQEIREHVDPRYTREMLAQQRKTVGAVTRELEQAREVNDVTTTAAEQLGAAPDSPQAKRNAADAFMEWMDDYDKSGQAGGAAGIAAMVNKARSMGMDVSTEADVERTLAEYAAAKDAPAEPLGTKDQMQTPGYAEKSLAERERDWVLNGDK